MSFPSPTPKQARILWASLTALAVGVLVGLLGLLVWGLGLVLAVLSPVLWPLAIAGVLAYLLDPVVDFFERRKMPRGRAILLVFALCLLCVSGLLANLVPRLIHETERLVRDMPAYAGEVQESVTRWISRRPLLLKWSEKLWPGQSGHTGSSTNTISGVPGAAESATNRADMVSAPSAADNELIHKITEEAINWVATAAPKVGSWLLGQLSKVASWAGMVIGLAMVPVFTFYFLREKKGIQQGWTRYLPVQESKFKDELVFVLKAINDYLVVFFRGQVLVALCDGVLITLGFMAMGLNYAVLLGVFVAVLSIVPYLGTILTIIPSMILAAVQFRDGLHPLLVVGIFAVVHALDGFVISPKIMGDRVGLHPLTVIVALLVGTTLLGGLLGGVLAIPLTAALRVVMFRYIWKKREA